VQIPLAVLISVLIASLAPWVFLVGPCAWLVWQVVKEPAPVSVFQHDGNA
jgi:hypothetical protein